ncbi:MAG: hypothetical protein ACLS9T_07415 [Streptococcus salivarius]
MKQASDEDLSVDNQALKRSRRRFRSQKKVKSLWITTLRMSWLITMLRRLQVAAAAEKGETVTFEAVQTRKVEEKPEEVQASKLKQNKKNIIVRLRRRVLVLLLA